MESQIMAVKNLTAKVNLIEYNLQSSETKTELSQIQF